MAKDKKEYVNILTGLRITAAEYNSLNKFDQGEYDKISSVRKAKAAIAVEDEEE